MNKRNVKMDIETKNGIIKIGTQITDDGLKDSKIKEMMFNALLNTLNKKL